MEVRVISWNLFHGRDHAPDRALHTWRSRLLRITERGADHVQVNRDLFEQFAGLLADAEWDVALLQECPPRWAEELATRTRAEPHLVLTARNLPPALRALQSVAADLSPDLTASWEGGSNLTLVRARSPSVPVVADRRELTLTRRPETRRMAFTRLQSGLCIANLHASEARESAERELEMAAGVAVSWAAGDPLVFGGDFNLRAATSGPLLEGLLASHGLQGRPSSPQSVDHIRSRGMAQLAAASAWMPAWRDVPEPAPPTGSRALPIRLSDHAPIEAVFGFEPRGAETGAATG